MAAAPGQNNREDFEQIKRELLASERIFESINKNVSSYVLAQKELLTIALNIKKQNQKILEIENELTTATGDRREILKAELEFNKQELKLLEAHERQLKRNKDLLSASVNSVKELGKEFLKVGSNITGLDLSWQGLANGIKDSIKDMYNLDKTIRLAEKSIGLNVGGFNTLRKSIEGINSDITILGVAPEELVKSYSDLTESLGRNISISTENFRELSLIAKGTGLELDGAVSIVEKLNGSGIGLKDSMKFVEKTTNAAKVNGINATKLLKTFTDNITKAQSFNFKNGLEGLKRMAIEAQKIKYDIQDTFNLADKLFEPEAAIDMAANLQILGGEFSKLADPFQLMYMARNDVEGLNKSIIDATKNTAVFNKETGEFEIPAMELHRLKKVADATGLSFDNLKTSALESAKRTKVMTNAMQLSKTNQEFVASIAKMQKDANGKVEILVDTEKGEKLISQLTNSEVELLKGRQRSLEETAKKSQGFDDMLKNVLNSLKVAFLPLVSSVNNFLTSENGIQRITDFANNLQKFFKNALQPLADFFEKGDMSTDGFFTAIKEVLGKVWEDEDTQMGIKKLGELFAEGIKNAFSVSIRSSIALIGTGISSIGGFLLKTLKSIGEIFPKILKTGLIKGLKAIPIFGSLFSIGSAVTRFAEGDVTGGLIDVGSGLANAANIFAPGLGSAVSLGLDGINMYRDANKKSEGVQAEDALPVPSKPLNYPYILPKGSLTPIKGIPQDTAYLASQTPVSVNTPTQQTGNNFNGNINISGTILIKTPDGMSKDISKAILDGLERDASFLRQLRSKILDNNNLAVNVN